MTLNAVPGQAPSATLPDDAYRSSAYEVEREQPFSPSRVIARTQPVADVDRIKLPHLRAQLSPAALGILETWDVDPLTPLAERTLRMVSSKYMRKGFCHATQVQLATSLGTVKSTLQRGLDELEYSNCIVVERRPPTSNKMYLVDGVKDALRVQHLERKAHEKRMNAGLNASKRRSNRPKALPHQQLSHGNSLLTSKTNKQQQLGGDSAPVACLTEQEKNAIEQLIAQNVAAHEAANLATTAPAEFIQDWIECGVHLTKRNPAGFLVSAIRNRYELPTLIDKSIVKSDSVNTPTNQEKNDQPTATLERTKLHSELLTIGFPPSIASLTVSIYSADRIRRQLRSEKYLTAKNKVAFLLAAIRNDYAASEPIPGSEHALVRAQENHGKPTVVRQANTLNNPIPLPAIQPSRHEIESAMFAQVDHDERSRFEDLARQKIESAPPIYIVDVLQRDGINNTLVQAVIRTKAIELWKNTRVVSGASYA